MPPKSPRCHCDVACDALVPVKMMQWMFWARVWAPSPLDKSTGSADAADPDDASADLGVVAGTTKIFFFFAGAAAGPADSNLLRHVAVRIQTLTHYCFRSRRLMTWCLAFYANLTDLGY